MSPMISASNVTKTYESGLTALEAVNLEIVKGEIFALLGPERRRQDDADRRHLRHRLDDLGTGPGRRPRHRARISRRPLEDWAWCRRRSRSTSSRRFGTRCASVDACSAATPDDGYVETLLRDLSLWEKRDSRIVELSGGMKRRVMIAKALSHEPDALFLDEPTAGVDVNLRRDMWALVRRLRDKGVTVILTTHYIEEAEEMADRVGVINNGRLVLVEEKAALMRKLGKRRLTLTLRKPLSELPASLADWPLVLDETAERLAYTFNADAKAPAFPPARTPRRAWGSTFAISKPRRARSRTFSSTSWGKRA